MSLGSRSSSRNASIISKKPKKSKRTSSVIKKPTNNESEKPIPDGILPLLLTSSTQEIFNLKIDLDVHSDDFLRKIKKEEIMKDIFNRAAVSDFKQYKEVIHNYPNDEIIICYDYNFQYGNNFYMATTTEAANLLLAEPENSLGGESVDEGPFIYTPPVSKIWLSYGSEREIEEETVKNRRKPISMTIIGSKKMLDRPREFSDRDLDAAKDGLINIKPLKCDDEKIRIQLCDKSSQTFNKTAENSSQVEWRYPVSKTTQYEYLQLDSQEKAQYEENLAKTVYTKRDIISSYLQQNQIFDIFENEWTCLGDSQKVFDNKLDIHLKEYQSFSDLKYTTAKIVSCIRWHPLYSGIIAVSLIHDGSYDERINNEQNMLTEKALILFWSFSDPINPQLLLEAPDDVTVFDFNPSNPHYIGAGCINGSVVVWDITEYSHYLQMQTVAQKTTEFPGYESENTACTPCCDSFATTAIGFSHSCAVSDLIWIPSHFEISKNGEPMENSVGFSCQLISCGLDSTLFIFDIRNYRIHQWERERAESKSKMTFDYLNLSWKPLLKITTFHKEKAGFYYPLKFSIHECGNSETSKKQQTVPVTIHECSQKLYTSDKSVLNNITTMFYVGTDDGDLLYLNWMPEKDFEAGKFETPKPEFAVNEHYGPITALARSPFLRDLILCVGGWNFSLWKENFHSGPLLKSRKFNRRITSAEWSLSRPSVFFLGRDDGAVDIWDLLDKTHEPIASQSISLSPIMSISLTSLNNKQFLMAVGDKMATLHIIKIPQGLSSSNSNELSQFKGYIDREIRRRIFVRKRFELREEEKEREHLEQKKQAGMAPLIVLSKEEIELRMKVEYSKFLEEEREVLYSLGILND